ncbi:hypothetical protein A8C56_22555 [Niabella ginsenosidivorans]|uniref:Tc1-like transposase DDE domain-containing protein n=1 Tax=Niabella ginsenosidivorans TaxID=1176587 RepID=A0A1A9IA19_9BACT|nr:hypothetical protein A8C56_22555 [Niabella ginsenosidivorans]
MPYCNTTDCFQVFLNEFACHHSSEYKIIVLDNGAFHKAAKLIVQPNIALFFLPPYSLGLNPAEKAGQFLKRKLLPAHSAIFSNLNWSN